jgi:hypothetical protein
MGMNESIYDKTGPDEFPTSRANRLFSCRIWRIFLVFKNFIV